MKKLSLLVAVIICLGLTQIASAQNQTNNQRPFRVMDAERIIGIEFTEAERDSMARDLQSQLNQYQALRGLDIPNSRSPVLLFDPMPLGWTPPNYHNGPSKYSVPPNLRKPERIESLAFATVVELGELIRTRQITSVELTRMYLDRLKKFDSELMFVVTLIEDEAMNRAAAMDAEIAAGKYRGPLHGIPYGAKDLLSYPGHKTTWGATPYKDQELADTAAVIEKLDEAGAVLTAKLTLGALAWGDVWFGGMTRNPWNTDQGASGSSAGSGSSVSSGALPFAIGSETLGSIVSPSTRNGVTGLRPTFGRVSRHGAMALSWTMDKLGPMCRSAEDCAIVLEAINGRDDRDATTRDMPFAYNADKPLSSIRVGYFKSLFDANYQGKANDQAILNVLDSIGVELIEVSLPEFPNNALSFILSAEAAAAFDELTRSNRDDELVRQVRNAWPNVFRAARFIPAVEYINANRARGILIDRMHEALKGVDVVITPSFGGPQLQMTNLTGHPALVMPNGYNNNGSPTSITIIGQLFGEADIVRLGAEIQKHTDFHKRMPPKFAVTGR
jgi:Asp-tRNA(Asn)/Glu-tRNA(Gln) amidotransferase A subunit family amidase